PQAGRPRCRGTNASAGVLTPAFGESALGQETQRQLLARCDRIGSAPDKLGERFKHGIRPRCRQSGERAVDGGDFIFRPARARLRQVRQRVVVATLLRIERDERIDDFGTLRIELARAEVAALGFRKFSELGVGLAEVVVAVGAARPFLERALEDAHGVVQLLRLGIGDAQRIEVRRVAPVQLVGAQGTLDRLASAPRANDEPREHVPRIRVARILGHDLPKRVLGRALVACLQGAGHGLHQRYYLWGEPACHGCRIRYESRTYVAPERAHRGPPIPRGRLAVEREPGKPWTVAARVYPTKLRGKGNQDAPGSTHSGANMHGGIADTDGVLEHGEERRVDRGMLIYRAGVGARAAERLLERRDLSL